jgi:hypothetical protein
MAQGSFCWSEFAEVVALEILGSPNAEMSRPPDDVRFGQRPIRTSRPHYNS